MAKQLLKVKYKQTLFLYHSIVSDNHEELPQMLLNICLSIYILIHLERSLYHFFDLLFRFFTVNCGILSVRACIGTVYVPYCRVSFKQETEILILIHSQN